MAPMTRTQTRAYGVVTPSSRQPLLEAMLRAFVWLVSNLALACRAILNRPTRDWHTDEPEEDQLEAPNDITQETNSEVAVILGPVPRIPVAPTQGTTTHCLHTPNQAARHTGERDTVDLMITVLETDLLVRVPRAAGNPASAQHAHLTYAGQSPPIPTNVGIQGRPRHLSQVAASSMRLQHNRSWIPTPHPELVEGRRTERLVRLKSA